MYVNSKGSLTSVGFSKKGVKSLHCPFSWKVLRGVNLAIFFGDGSQNEKLSKIKLPLIKLTSWKSLGIIDNFFAFRTNLWIHDGCSKFITSKNSNGPTFSRKK